MRSRATSRSTAGRVEAAVHVISPPRHCGPARWLRPGVEQRRDVEEPVSWPNVRDSLDSFRPGQAFARLARTTPFGRPVVPLV